MTLQKKTNDDNDDRVTDNSSQLNSSGLFDSDPLQSEDIHQVEKSISEKDSAVQNNHVIVDDIDVSGLIYPNEVNETGSTVPLSPEEQLAVDISDNNGSILESAFSGLFRTEITADSVQPESSTTFSEPPELLQSFHSTEDVQKIHDQSINARSVAFHQLTQLKNDALVVSEEQLSISNCFADVDLALELSKIKKDENVDAFIEEFEKLLSNLNTQKPIIEKKPDDINYLIQFKTSIHMIKLLSGMMQASHLNHFSQTVIDYLDDLVEGKSSLTFDLIERLSVVVNYYDHYHDVIKNDVIKNDSIKGGTGYKTRF